ncbi:MAG TPA: sigma-70 family RNA polymerase sigma factor [Symbiobacteriaceae bacterium]|nr:sigma-70 family RNA polymerase sigma factor [Symbiobacteriaceae bacterium]
MDLQDLYTATFRRALLLLGDRHEAEDAAQEAVTRLLGQGTGTVKNPGAWLRQVVSRLAYDALRRGQRIRGLPPADAGLTDPYRSHQEAPPDPAQVMVEHEQVRLVRTALDRLSPRDRLILLLRAEGLPYKEIAQAVHCRPGSVGTLLARAERRLKEQYELVANAPARR